MMMKTMAFITLILMASLASCHSEEAKGVVTRITDGATFEVSELGCVRLADVMSVPSSSLAGISAREFTRDNLMGTQVFLDIDNQTGQDESGCWMCVVYKASANGTADLDENFNKIYANAGYGMLRDNPKTEFDPMSW